MYLPRNRRQPDDAIARAGIAPLFEGPVRGDGQRAAFVAGGDEPEQQLGAGVIERSEADSSRMIEVDTQQRCR